MYPKPLELIGTNARVYIHPEDLPVVARTFQRYIAGSDEKMRATYRVRRKDGEYCWVETGARPIVGTYGLFREILFVSQSVAEGEGMRAGLLEENDEIGGGNKRKEEGMRNIRVRNDMIKCMYLCPRSLPELLTEIKVNYEERKQVRQQRSKPLVEALHVWLQTKMRPIALGRVFRYKMVSSLKDCKRCC